jgi:hypothetical protein
MPNRIKADSASGLQLISDSSDEIQIQSGSSTVATINSNGLLSSGHVIQVVSNTFTNRLSYGTADGSGAATGITNGFTIIPTHCHTDITAKGNNSKFLVMFDGNIGTTNDGTNGTGDWIGGIGLVVDPAGGTSWTQIGSGTNTANTTNIKFFHTRGNATATGNDPYFHKQMSHNTMYTSSVSSGTTLRFGAEYFHYDTAIHNAVIINRTPSNADANNTYNGGNATTITVMEIAG